MKHVKPKKTIPHGTRYLFITCYKPNDPQFKGLYSVTRLFMKKRYCYCHDYRQTGTLDLSRRRKLAWVLISGHGGEDGARMTDGKNTRLYPRNIRLPKKTKFLLLGCHQGLPGQKEEWARGVNLPLKNIYGADGESETALSTLCLLNIWEHGIPSAMKWFTRWIKANSYFRPKFEEIREEFYCSHCQSW